LKGDDEADNGQDSKRQKGDEVAATDCDDDVNDNAHDGTGDTGSTGGMGSKGYKDSKVEPC